MLKIRTLSKKIPAFLLLLFFLTNSFAVNSVKSPFFVVKSSESNLNPQLPLIHTEANVTISGVIANVKVKQIYVNNGYLPIEAMYVFPGTSKSAVYGMQMRIGNRLVIAEIQEKKQARATYEKAKSEGKTASLLEQHRPNVFQMNVANILAGDTIIVELNYTELLTPENGIYQFVYPTIVAPRYGSEKDMANNQWVDNLYSNEETSKGSSPSHTFDINVHLEAGTELGTIGSESHQVDINQLNSSSAKIGLRGGKGYEGDRDYILKYQLVGPQISSGMLLYEGEEENFFLMMMQPPKRISPDQIPPREYIFIVDVSGSMNGFPIEISKQLIRDLIGDLRPIDRFNVLLFAGSSEVMSPQSVAGTPENIQKGIALIENEKGRGGTEMLPALKRAMNLPKSDGFARTVVIATDGLVQLEKEAFQLIRENLGEANFFPFGIGTSTNRFIIDGLAHAGQGESFLATSKKEAEEAAVWFKKYIESPVLTNIKTSFKGINVYDVEPKSIPDIFAERPVVVFGKYKKKSKGAITIDGISGKSPYQMKLNWKDFTSSNKNEALKYLWARQRITILSDYNQIDRKSDKKTIKAITDLGLKYNLMTDYTSFVAVDHQIRDSIRRVDARKKKNPALYANNSNHLKSYPSSGAAPEPNEWAFIILLSVFSFWLFWFKLR